jgi:hypothetical protein
MSDTRGADKSSALAQKLNRAGYNKLEELTAFDWYVQFAVRRECFEFARRWKPDRDKYSLSYPRYAKVLEMIGREPIVSILDIVNSGFKLSDFFDLATFYPDRNGQYDIFRPAQPMLYRHLPHLRLALHEAAAESFCRGIGSSFITPLHIEWADEWMLGKRELPRLPKTYSNPIKSMDFGDAEFLRIDTSASDKDILAHFKAYLGQLATRIERKRSQKVTVPGNLESRKRRHVQRQGTRRSTRRDSYSIWTHLRVLPCMDIMLVAAFQGNPKISNGTIGDALSQLFGEDWAAARVRTTRGRVSEMLDACGRLFAELERSAFDMYVEKRNSVEFRDVAALIDHEMRIGEQESFDFQAD